MHTIVEQQHGLEMFTTGLHPDADVKICFVDQGNVTDFFIYTYNCFFYINYIFISTSEVVKDKMPV